MSANYDATAGSEKGRSRSFGEQSSRVAEEAQELGRTALSTASEAATTLREKGRHALEAGREKAKHAKEQMDHVVAENPMKSVLIALGVGVLIGYVLHRKH